LFEVNLFYNSEIIIFSFEMFMICDSPVSNVTVCRLKDPESIHGTEPKVSQTPYPMVEKGIFHGGYGADLCITEVHKTCYLDAWEQGQLYLLLRDFKLPPVCK
jgi:hypothetical protein